MIMRGKEENFPSQRNPSASWHYSSTTVSIALPKRGTITLSSPTYVSPPRSRFSPSPPDQFSSPHQSSRRAIHLRLGFRISGYFYRCPYPLVHPPDPPRSGESETREQKSGDVNLRSALFCARAKSLLRRQARASPSYQLLSRNSRFDLVFGIRPSTAVPFRFRDLRFRTRSSRGNICRTEIRR